MSKTRITYLTEFKITCLKIRCKNYIRNECYL